MNKITVTALYILFLPIATFLFLVDFSSAESTLDRYQNVSLQELANPPKEDWLMWRRTSNHWGYSPLDQINKENVENLRLAWAWTMEPGLQETTLQAHRGCAHESVSGTFVTREAATRSAWARASHHG